MAQFDLLLCHLLCPSLLPNSPLKTSVLLLRERVTGNLQMTHPTEEEEEAGERPLDGMSERLTLIYVDNDSWIVTTNNSKMHDHPHKF